MRQDIEKTTIYLSDYDSQMMPTSENQNYGLGSSQVSEPEIIIPISPLPNTPPKKNTLILEDIENDLPQETPTQSGTQNTGSTNTTSPTAQGEPSATTNGTKTYVGGGTTPDSQIVVKKPTTKYFVYGIVGLVGAYLVYKMFFNKKTE
jgi:hypothetical protein